LAVSCTEQIWRHLGISGLGNWWHKERSASLTHTCLLGYWCKIRTDTNIVINVQVCGAGLRIEPPSSRNWQQSTLLWLCEVSDEGRVNVAEEDMLLLGMMGYGPQELCGFECQRTCCETACYGHCCDSKRRSTAASLCYSSECLVQTHWNAGLPVRDELDRTHAGHAKDT